MLVCSCSVEQEDKIRRSGTAGICVLGFALSLAPQCVTLPWPCFTQVSRRAPHLCSCLASQQCWADCKCRFSMEEESTAGQKCVGGDSQNSNLCIIILLLLRTVFHVLFIKSFEHLLVKYPVGHRTVYSQLGRPALEPSSTAAVLKGKQTLNLQQFSVM